MNKLFEYIDKSLRKSKTVSLHTWGDDERTGHYIAMKKSFNPASPIMNYGNVNYMITEYAASNGHGGMSEGSPHTFLIKILNLDNVVKVKSDGRPMPVENPDFTLLIKNLEDDMQMVADGKYHEDNDNAQYLWEHAMKIVYGKDVFDWWNKNAY